MHAFYVRVFCSQVKGAETVVDAFEDGCIVQVDYYNTKTFPNSQGGAFSSATSRSNCSHLERVVSELRERVDVELGFVEDSKDRLSPKVLMFSFYMSHRLNSFHLILFKKASMKLRLNAADLK